MQNKNCTYCKKDIELGSFSKDVSRPDGLEKTCKECRKKQREDRKKARKDANIPSHKKCNSCKKTLSSGKFDKTPDTMDHLHSECKICKRKKRQVIKKANKEIKLPDKYEKICSSCNISYPKDNFYNQIYSKDGIDTICSKCSKKRSEKWRSLNPQKIKEYRTKEYFKNYKSRRESKPTVKLAGNIRNRIRMTLKRDNSSKFNNTFDLIDCSPSFFKKWLEHQFDSQMTWGNYGSYWHVDHVIPCSLYDLKKRSEQLACFNWRNCRPLEAKRNMSDSNKYQPLQILFQEIKVHYYERQDQIAGNP
jgi:hypothetical protein